MIPLKIRSHIEPTMKIKKSRRQFLQSSGALLLSAAASSPKLAFSAANSSSEDYWEMVRSQFSFTENAVPMNAANLCPSFRAVSEKVALLTADIDQDCSFNNRAKFNDLQETHALLWQTNFTLTATKSLWWEIPAKPTTLLIMACNYKAVMRC